MFTKRTDLFQLQVIILMVLALCLPFSVEIGVTENHKLFLPTEPLLVLFNLTVLFDLISKKIRLSDLLNHRMLIVVPFIMALIISALFSQIKTVSLKFSLINILYIFSFFVCLIYILSKAPWLFKKLMALYTTGLFLLFFLAIYRYSVYEWNPTTVKGLFVPFYKDHTIFGATAALLAGYWLLVPVLKSSLRIFALQRITGLLLCGVVVISYSRAAIISLFVIGFIYLILQLKLRIWHLLSMGGLILISLLLNSQTILTILQRNIYDSGNKQSDLIEHTLSSGNINTDVSNLERLNRWDAGIQMFRQRPIIGYGPGTYQFEYIPFQKPKNMNRLSVKDPYNIPENSGGTAHSEYILATSEMGVLGIIAWLVLLGGMTIMLFKRKTGEPKSQQSIAAYAALSSYFFHALFNNFLNTDKFAFVFWGLAAWFCLNTITNRNEGK